MELSGTTRQVPRFGILSFVNFQEKLTGTSFALRACEASFFGLLCDWR
jgi:hypothetical protein